MDLQFLRVFSINTYCSCVVFFLQRILFKIDVRRRHLLRQSHARVRLRPAAMLAAQSVRRPRRGKRHARTLAANVARMMARKAVARMMARNGTGDGTGGGGGGVMPLIFGAQRFAATNGMACKQSPLTTGVAGSMAWSTACRNEVTSWSEKKCS